MPLCDKLVVGVDLVVGATNIVVGACDVVVGVSDFVEYARAGWARLRGKASSGGCGAKSNPYLLEGGSTASSSGVKEDETKSTMIPCCHRKRIRENGRYDVLFEDLPNDTLCIILSKLNLKEAGRTSVLSSKWTNMWLICPILRFVDSEMCGKYVPRKQKTQKFIETVNAVLALQQGKVVETLEIKIEFKDRVLLDHLGNWVSFAAASRTKNLALDLAPKKFKHRTGGYVFPFELLDGATMSRLERIQLSFVFLKLPSEFSGFPKLKKLDLHLVKGTKKYLQNMLSGCSNLEWLSMVRCGLKDGLTLDRPMSHLLYLHVSHCGVKKIELDVPKLRTFTYKGERLPYIFDLGQAEELKVADIYLEYSTITLEDAVTHLPEVLESVQSLTLDASVRLTSPEQELMENAYQFYQLKHLKLLLPDLSEDTDNCLFLAYFLEAAPLIEELEIHLNISHYRKADIRHDTSMQNCQYEHLRCMRITGFEGIGGQAEFLAHTVENAPALEVLTIETASQISPLSERGDHSGARIADHSGGARIAESCLEGKLSPKTTLHMLTATTN